MEPTSEILLWHFWLGLIPFLRLQTMAKAGLLPRRLNDCRVPKCASCIYEKMTRRAKRSKNKASKISARTITGLVGSCVSVDQLKSSTLGLIAHMKGTPTVQRYHCATVYIDHYSHCPTFTCRNSLRRKKPSRARLRLKRSVKYKG